MLDDFYAFIGTTEGRLTVGAVFGIICGTLGHRKGYRALPWFVAGALFSVLALVVVLCKGVDKAGLERRAVRNGEAKRCPQCAEIIRSDAKVCRFCQAGASDSLAAS